MTRPAERADERELRELRRRRRHVANAARYDRELRDEVESLDEQIRSLEKLIPPTCAACRSALSLVDGRYVCTWRPCVEAERAEIHARPRDRA